MATTSKSISKRLPRGEKIPRTARGWRLQTPRKKYFKASLVKVLYVGDERLAIFRVF